MPRREIKLVKCERWPFGAAEARKRQSATAPFVRTLDLGGGVTIELVRIPAGRFVMGSGDGEQDESPQSVVTITKPYWMARHEVTNRQYARFDPAHDSRFEHRSSWIFSEDYLGWPLNGPQQPVVRVSCEEATAFCEWLSRRTGLQVALPTEGEWEYACRAGSQTEWWYGDRETDFGKFANMADQTMRELAYEAWRPRPPDIVARDDRFNDGQLVTANVGSYAAHPW